MKATNYFKNTIQNYLEQRAQTDALFEWIYTTKENKNIDDCCTYILNEVHKSGCNGFADDEIFSMAVHYYDEDTIDMGKPMNNTHVVVNHIVELTEEEKRQAHQDAIEKAQKEAYNKMMQPKKRVSIKQTTTTNQLSLF